MGRDKSKPNPADAKVTNQTKEPDAKITNAGRGHRQRGAGTIITAKAPVVTQDGIVLKAHERLPCQILNEYCQREKRPLPKYHANPPGHRYRCHLGDPKNSKYDLEFAPMQSAESDKVARDYAALLALFHLQKTMPLERKLPEPFATTWLQMISNDKDGTSSKAIALTASVSAADLKSVEKGADEIDSIVIVPSLSRETSDWLCDSCNTQNFAKLASGLPRLKCFRCQTTKSDSCTLVASADAIKSGGSSGKAVDTKSSSKSSAPVSAKGSSSDNLASLPNKQSDMVKKIPPKAVLDLRNEKTFSSEYDKEKIDLEFKLQKSRRAAFFDALKRANRPTPILLSPYIRNLLETVLGITRAVNLEIQQESVDIIAALNGIQHHGIEFDDDSIQSVLEKQFNVDKNLQYRASLRTKDILQGQGFSDYQIYQSFKLLQSKGESILDELSSVNLPTIEESFVSVLRDHCIEQLCLQTDETELPKLLDSSYNADKTQVQVISTKGNPTTEIDLNGKSIDIETEVNEKYDSLISRIALYGWKRHNINMACDYIEQYHPWIQRESNIFQLKVLLLLLRASGVESIDKRHIFTDNIDITASSAEDIQTEIESLHAIFGQDIISSYDSHDSIWNVSILSSKLGIAMDFYLLSVSSFLAYPTSFPAIVLIRPNDAMTVRAGALMSFNCSVLQKAQSLIGEAMIFSLASYIDETYQDFMTKQALLVGDNQNDFNVSNIMRESLPSAIDHPAKTELEMSSSSDLAKTSDDIEKLMDTISLSLSENATIKTDSETSSSSSKQSNRTASFWNKSNHSKRVSDIRSIQPSSDMLAFRKTLPAWNSREEFLQMLQMSKGLVVTGETGCGKSTQIPQFIYEAQSTSKIVICQPRRLAAIGVATRVAEEMGSAIGDLVGYMVKGESKVSAANTKVVFCTYGVLLRRLQDDPILHAIDYIILDEVHERNLESDFSLALLLSAVEKRSSLHLILMSATISTEKFSEYLRPISNGKPSPILSIPGFTYPVEQYYRNEYEADIQDISFSILSKEQGEYQSNEQDTILGGYRRKGEIDYNLIVRLVLSLVCTEDSSNNRMLRRAEGTILIFMPGVPEINKLITMLDRYVIPYRPSYIRVKIMSLHGNLSSSEQKKVFIPAGKNDIKIVVATNVAEASVTISDVTVVIDSCRVKEMNYDLEKCMSVLTLKLASKDSLQQRKGRAGRVQEGRCFRIITSHIYEKLSPHTIPEILRTPLERLILQIKATVNKEDDIENDEDSAKETNNINPAADVIKILSRCLDPPAVEAIEQSLRHLASFQAINTRSGLITPLGRHMAAMAADPKISKLLIYGALLGCTLSISAIAAYIASKSPYSYSNDSNSRNMIDEMKLSMMKEAQISKTPSDHILFSYTMKRYRDSSDKKRFCRDYCLSYDQMMETAELQEDYLEELVSLGFLSSIQEGLSADSPANTNDSVTKIVSASICAGLYPSLAKILRPPKRFVEVAGGNIERDAEAKEIQVFIPTDTFSSNTNHPSSTEDSVDSNADINTKGLQRVFIHPSSVNFQNKSYRSSNYIMYSNTIATDSQSSYSMKAYIKDITEVSPISLLLFGGRIDVQYFNGIVTVDGWIRFSAPGKVVAIMRSLRKAKDSLLSLKVSDPTINLHQNPILDAVAKLLASDGLIK